MRKWKEPWNSIRLSCLVTGDYAVALIKMLNSTEVEQFVCIKVKLKCL